MTPLTLLGAPPHHDGSELYVPEQPGELGDEAIVRMRVPHGTDVERSAVRYVHDGEPRVAAARDRRARRRPRRWWRASSRVWNPVTATAGSLAGGDSGYAWLNGPGVVSAATSPTRTTSSSPSDPGARTGISSSVVYEIYPDRFASSGSNVDAARLGGAA